MQWAVDALAHHRDASGRKSLVVLRELHVGGCWLVSPITDLGNTIPPVPTTSLFPVVPQVYDDVVIIRGILAGRTGTLSGLGRVGRLAVRLHGGDLMVELPVSSITRLHSGVY